MLRHWLAGPRPAVSRWMSLGSPERQHCGDEDEVREVLPRAHAQGVEWPVLEGEVVVARIAAEIDEAGEEQRGREKPKPKGGPLAEGSEESGLLSCLAGLCRRLRRPVKLTLVYNQRGSCRWKP